MSYKGNILITGAGGFIGTAIFLSLKKKGYKVFGVDFDYIKHDENLIDLNLLNIDTNNNVIKDLKPNFVYHLAAYAGPPRNEKNPKFARKYNVELTKKLLKSLNKNTRIFFPSTDKIFEGIVFPDENIKLNPPNVHGKLKLECENLIKAHTKNHFIFRQPVVHAYGGHFQSTKMSGTGSFLDQSVDLVQKKTKVKIFSNVKRCFLKLDELIHLYEILLTSEKYGTYNLSSPIKSYYNRLIEICDSKKIDYQKYIIPTEGNVNPLEQDINSEKFEKNFNFKFS
tara:strand:+ start:1514 stop:2359 length:846 start_codon:yes stop_codon:yes gene_type:complete